MGRQMEHSALKQKRYGVRVADAIALMDEWFAKGNIFLWSRTPDEVKTELQAAADANGIIDLQRATAILSSAETAKACAPANAGMVWMREQWRIERVLIDAPDQTKVRPDMSKKDRQRWIEDTQLFQRVAGIAETSAEELGAEYDAFKIAKKGKKKNEREASTVPVDERQ